ncbi:hypothetical protein HELRODRAFT_159414 [Helobdella robusta]|uniref:Uncharacterized protein n=1 Tax=Helobdella robusta TaxID=6412 RepID=T1EP06_HELRO|nr:hypothetical protein HELRODRAFT_159414 [Helobdella robusta]ESO12827.1 hypothetical protein HELRODRAFT_159414 [Helobdella robusta]
MEIIKRLLQVPSSAMVLFGIALLFGAVESRELGDDTFLTFAPEYVALVGLGILFFVLFLIVITILCMTGTRDIGDHRPPKTGSLTLCKIFNLSLSCLLIWFVFVDGFFGKSCGYCNFTSFKLSKDLFYGSYEIGIHNAKIYVNNNCGHSTNANELEMENIFSNIY